MASHSPGTQEGQQPLLLQVPPFPPLSQASRARRAAPVHQELPERPEGYLGSQAVCGSCSPSPLSHSITQHAAPTLQSAAPHSPAALGIPEDPALLLFPETRETPSRLQQSQKPCPGHPHYTAAKQTLSKWSWGSTLPMPLALHTVHCRVLHGIRCVVQHGTHCRALHGMCCLTHVAWRVAQGIAWLQEKTSRPSPTWEPGAPRGPGGPGGAWGKTETSGRHAQP